MPILKTRLTVVGVALMAAAVLANVVPDRVLVRSPAAVKLNRDYEGVRLLREDPSRSAGFPFLGAASLVAIAAAMHAIGRHAGLPGARRVWSVLLPATLYVGLNQPHVAGAALVALGAAALARRLPPASVTRAIGALAPAALVTTFVMPDGAPGAAPWVTPLLVLAARNRTELALAVAADVLSYLYVPLAYDRFGPGLRSLGFVLGALTATRAILLTSLAIPPAPTSVPEPSASSEPLRSL